MIYEKTIFIFPEGALPTFQKIKKLQLYFFENEFNENHIINWHK